MEMTLDKGEKKWFTEQQWIIYSDSRTHPLTVKENIVSVSMSPELEKLVIYTKREHSVYISLSWL